MPFLYGEWPVANILFAAVFLAAAIGVVGIGFWVVRSDRLNRVDERPGDPVEHHDAR